MNNTEKMILAAIANGAKIDNDRHLNKALCELHRLGFIHCVFDEQGEVILARVTPLGKKAISLQSK